MWVDLFTIFFLVGAFCLLLMHFGSKIQMRAWLQELETFLKEKYTITKNEKDNE